MISTSLGNEYLGLIALGGVIMMSDRELDDTLGQFTIAVDREVQKITPEIVEQRLREVRSSTGSSPAERED